MNNTKRAAVALAGLWLGLAGISFAAENSIKQIQVRRDGDQVLLKVQMAAPLKSMPGNWSVVEPPRVVIDFPETDNKSGQSTQQVAEGDLKSLNVVQSDKLTRLVLNLYRPTKFSTEIAGDVLFIKLQGQGVQATSERAPSVFQRTASPAAGASGSAVARTEAAAIRDILFPSRRGRPGLDHHRSDRRHRAGRHTARGDGPDRRTAGCGVARTPAEPPRRQRLRHAGYRDDFASHGQPDAHRHQRPRTLVPPGAPGEQPAVDRGQTDSGG
jgi:hypothetical protein